MIEELCEFLVRHGVQPELADNIHDAESEDVLSELVPGYGFIIQRLVRHWEAQVGEHPEDQDHPKFCSICERQIVDARNGVYMPGYRIDTEAAIAGARAVQAWFGGPYRERWHQTWHNGRAACLSGEPRGGNPEKLKVWRAVWWYGWDNQMPGMIHD